MPNRPNILYLHSHDTGRYIQPYGYPIPTPRLQEFAEQSAIFRQAFCAAPTCSPSRAALLTGKWAHSCGMLGLAHRGFGLADYDQHLVRVLKRNGYLTALAGMQHEARDGHIIGYEEVLPTKSSWAKDVAPLASEFLLREHDRPFFLSAGLTETHREFPDPAIDPRFVRPPAPIPDTPATRKDTAAFATSARAMDSAFGTILDALQQSGQANSTIVIVTTDHGPAFPVMKGRLTDHGVGVLLMIRGAQGFDGGKVLDAVVTHMDIFPTLCELIGIDPPAGLQGKSLIPLISGLTNKLHDAIFAEINFHAAYEPERSVRTDRYKYIRRFSSRSLPVLPNMDRGLSKDLWLEAGWQNIDLEDEQLYDLILDPMEGNNLAGEARTKEVLDEMRAILQRWMSDTDDPLLNGPLIIPAGATVDDVCAVDPGDKAMRYEVPTPAE